MSNTKNNADNKSNKKTILIVLGIVLFIIFGIVIVNYVIGSIKGGKDATVSKKMEKMIDEYLKIRGLSFSINVEGDAYFLYTCPNGEKKCKKEDRITDAFFETGVHKNGEGKKDYEFMVSNLVPDFGEKIEELVNPGNGRKCFDDFSSVDPIIHVYSSGDYDEATGTNNKVYYYYVDLSGSNTNCGLSKKNGIINTIPKELQKEMKKKGVKIPE